MSRSAPFGDDGRLSRIVDGIGAAGETQHLDKWRAPV